MELNSTIQEDQDHTGCFHIYAFTYDQLYHMLQLGGIYQVQELAQYNLNEWNVT